MFGVILSLFAWLIRLALGLLALVAIALIALYLGLRSPGVNAWLLEQTRPFLVDAGVEEAAFEYASLDLLRGLEIRGLEAVYRGPDPGRVALRIETLQVVYQPRALFDRAVSGVVVEVEGLAVDGRLVLPPSPPSDPPPPSEPTPLESERLPALLEQLAAIPVTLGLERLRVDGTIDLAVVQGAQRVRWVGPLQIDGQGQVAAERMTAQLTGRLGDSTAQLQLTDPTTGVDLATRPAIAVHLSANATRSERGWSLTVDPDPWRVDLRETEGRLARDGGPQTVAMERLQLDLAPTVRSQPSPGTRLPYPLAMDATLEGRVTGLRVRGALPEERLESALDYRFRVEASNRLFDLIRPFAGLRVALDQGLTLHRLAARSGPAEASVDGLQLDLSVVADDAGGPKREGAGSPLPLRLTSTLSASSAGIEAATPALSARLKPRLEWALEGRLAEPPAGVRRASTAPEPPAWPVEVTADWGQQWEIEDLEVVSQPPDGEAMRVTANRQTLDVRAHLHPDRATLATELRAEGLRLPTVLRPLDLEQRLDASTDLDLTQPGLQWSLELEGRRLATLDLTARDGDSTARLMHALELRLPHDLSRYHSGAEALHQVGDLAVSWNGTTRVTHGSPSGWREADWAAAARFPWASEQRVRVRQTAPPPDEATGIRFARPLRLMADLTADPDYSSQIALEVGGFEGPGLAAPIDLAAELEQTFGWPLRQAEASGSVRIQDHEALRYALSLDNAPQAMRLESEVMARVSPAWQAFLPALAPLEPFGDWQADLDLRTELSHPQSTALAITPAQLPELRARIWGSARVQQTGAPAEGPLRLVDPLVLEPDLRWSTARAEADVAVRGGSIHVPTARVAGPRLRLSGQVEPGLEPTAGQVELRADVDDLIVSVPGDNGTTRDLPLADLVAPAQLRVVGRRTDETAQLEDLRLDVSNGLLGLTGQGSASLDGQTAEMDALLTARPRPDLLATPRLGGSGTMRVPLSLILAEGRAISLNGEIQFDDFGLTLGDLELAGANGNLRLTEELTLTDDGAVELRYLTSADPFQRVDFNRIQPYLDERYTLSVDRLETPDLAIGPLLANASVEQNLLRLPELQLQLLDGHLAGQFYLDTTPGALQVGLLGRVSQIDLRRLLDEPPTVDYSPVSARVAINFDLTRRLMEGRVDFTEISHVQLLQLLDVVDPEHTDPQIGRLRAALRVAFPTSVTVAMRSSLMDITVGLSALPKPIRLRGLPLTPLIQQFAGELLREIESLPLRGPSARN